MHALSKTMRFTFLQYLSIDCRNLHFNFDYLGLNSTVMKRQLSDRDTVEDGPGLRYSTAYGR